MTKTLCFALLTITILACKTQQTSHSKASDNASTKVAPQPMGAPQANVVIYKTKNDYTDRVAVTLSEDKSIIVSYPHPTDLRAGNKLMLPTQLHNGYLLDNRGINKNVAFLRFTYSEYSALKEAPSLKELQNSILDKDPLTELWDCGRKKNYPDLQNQINEWIDKNQLAEKCKK